jgi:hypothetical protein
MQSMFPESEVTIPNLNTDTTLLEMIHAGSISKELYAVAICSINPNYKIQVLLRHPEMLPSALAIMCQQKYGEEKVKIAFRVLRKLQQNEIDFDPVLKSLYQLKCHSDILSADDVRLLDSAIASQTALEYAGREPRIQIQPGRMGAVVTTLLIHNPALSPWICHTIIESQLRQANYEAEIKYDLNPSEARNCQNEVEHDETF